MSSKSRSVYCAYVSCMNNSSQKKMYRFPKCEERSAEWVQASGNPKLLNLPAVKLNALYRLCEDHFHDWCFMNLQDKQRLVHNAVPDKLKSSVASVPKVEVPSDDDSSPLQSDNNTSVSSIYNIPSLFPSYSNSSLSPSYNSSSLSPSYNSSSLSPSENNSGPSASVVKQKSSGSWSVSNDPDFIASIIRKHNATLKKKQSMHSKRKSCTPRRIQTRSLHRNEISALLTTTDPHVVKLQLVKEGMHHKLVMTKHKE